MGDVNYRHRLAPLLGRRAQTMWLGSALILASFASCAAAAHSQVFRCVEADGHVVYSDTGCGSNSEKLKIVEASSGLSQINKDGLSSQEKSQLSAAEARAAASQSQPASSAPSGSAPAASAPISAPRSGY